MAASPSRIFWRSACSVSGRPMIFWRSMISLSVKMFSHAAALCRSMLALRAWTASAAFFASGVTGAKLVGITIPSACCAQPCSVSMLDELVRPTTIFGFTPWRAISLSTPQVVNGWAEMATRSAFERRISRTWFEKLVSASSHSLVPRTSKPVFSAWPFITL
jgi:hypothetical protein